MSRTKIDIWYCIDCSCETDRHFTQHPCACCGATAFIREEIECCCLYIPRSTLHQTEIRIGNLECNVHKW